MRIISDFKDYYDCCMQQSDLPAWKREQKEFHIDYYTGYVSGGMYIGFWLYRIYFCGKEYLCILVKKQIDVFDKMYNKYDPKFINKHGDYERACYSLQEFDESMKDLLGKDYEKYYKGNKNIWKLRLPNRDNVKSFYERGTINYGKDYVKPKEIDLEKNPIYICYLEAKYIRITINGELGELHFQKIMPPYQAYQELQMWFANKAAPMKPIPHVSDEDLAFAKGFDKFSFRKDRKTKK